MGDSREKFERSCRLCAEVQDVTLMIFSEEAKAMLLQNKLQKYLLIEVEQDDKLPKHICVWCCTKLQTVCDFIDSARKAQEVLSKQSIFLDNNTVASEQVAKQVIKTESENSIFDDETSQVSEMEVSVDPMVVLQNSQCQISPVVNEEGCASNYEDLTYLHGLEGEIVTIKLIKRGDNHNDSDDRKNEPDQKPFPCPICRRSFYTELALKNHSWSHNNEERTAPKDFHCSSCEESFENKCDLILHVKEHRSNGKCKICGRVFRNLTNLEIHMKSHTTSSHAYTCKVCGRAYNSRSNLKTHSITHSNERPYSCHICKKSFKRNQDLKFHINQHTGARPYKCPFCDKCFASSGNCYSHRSRMHPGKVVESRGRGRRRTVPVSRENQSSKPWLKNAVATVKGVHKYQCTICNHSFMKRDNFTYHMFQHTGETPFNCQLCVRKFVTRKGLLLHHEQEHPTQERPLALISKNALLK